MKYTKKDWQFYLKPEDLDEVEKVLSEVDLLNKKRRELQLSIHYIKNAACQKRRHAIGNISDARV